MNTQEFTAALAIELIQVILVQAGAEFKTAEGASADELEEAYFAEQDAIEERVKAALLEKGATVEERFCDVPALEGNVGHQFLLANGERVTGHGSTWYIGPRKEQVLMDDDSDE